MRTGDRAKQFNHHKQLCATELSKIWPLALAASVSWLVQSDKVHVWANTIGWVGVWRGENFISWSDSIKTDFPLSPALTSTSYESRGVTRRRRRRGWSCTSRSCWATGSTPGRSSAVRCSNMALRAHQRTSHFHKFFLIKVTLTPGTINQPVTEHHYFQNCKFLQKPTCTTPSTPCTTWTLSWGRVATSPRTWRRRRSCSRPPHQAGKGTPAKPGESYSD